MLHYPACKDDQDCPISLTWDVGCGMWDVGFKNKNGFKILTGDFYYSGVILSMLRFDGNAAQLISAGGARSKQARGAGELCNRINTSLFADPRRYLRVYKLVTGDLAGVYLYSCRPQPPPEQRCPSRLPSKSPRALIPKCASKAYHEGHKS